MKKICFFLPVLLGIICLPLQGKSLFPVQRPDAHVTVAEQPSFDSSNFDAAPFFKVFRCTNHTSSSLKLEITISRSYGSNPIQISSEVTLPGSSTREVSILAPRVKSGGVAEVSVNGPAGIKIKTIKSPPQRYSWLNLSSASPSFKPDFFEYLLGYRNFAKSPLPVKEWPADSRAYAGLPVILLESNDPLSSEIRRALRLAAARGSRVLVLVMGNDPWPSCAGTEKKGVPFEEKIGFGSWVVMRSDAVDSNPVWKNFVKRSHDSAKRNSRKPSWSDKKLLKYLHNSDNPAALAARITIPDPPVPINGLTLLMLCFVIIIGPVNYLILKRSNKVLWAIVTIPALSLLFTGAVIGYVLFGEGLESKGKACVETRLDQTNGIAATRGAYAVYAPTSVKAFDFSPEDLLYFSTYGKVDAEAGAEKYRYAGTLLRPRMSLSYGICRAEERSEKIAVSEKKEGVEIVNGLGVKVDSLYLRSSTNKLFKLDSPLAPGARALLTPVSKQVSEDVPTAVGTYTAQLSEPLFVTPGFVPDRYEYKQTVYGRWR